MTLIKRSPITHLCHVPQNLPWRAKSSESADFIRRSAAPAEKGWLMVVFIFLGYFLGLGFFCCMWVWGYMGVVQMGIKNQVDCLRRLFGGSMSIEGSFWLGESVVVLGCSTVVRGGARGSHFDKIERLRD